MKEKDDICDNCKFFDRFYIKEGMSFYTHSYGFCKCAKKLAVYSETCEKFLPTVQYPMEFANLKRSLKTVAGDVFILQEVFKMFEKKIISG